MDASRPRRDCPPSARSHWPCRALAHRALYFAGRSSRARVRLASGAWAWATARGCRTLIGSSRAVRRGSPIPKGCRCCRSCHLPPPLASLCSMLTRRGSAAAGGRCERLCRGRLLVCMGSVSAISGPPWSPIAMREISAARLSCSLLRLALLVMVVSGSDGSGLIDPSRRPRPLTPLVGSCLCLFDCLQTRIASAHSAPLALHSLPPSSLLSAPPQSQSASRPSR